MFRINVYGIGLMLVAGLVVHLVLRPLLPGNEPAWVVCAGLIMIVADVILRKRPHSKGAGNRWLSGEFGATIAFPAWIMGICLIGYGAAKHLGLTA